MIPAHIGREVAGDDPRSEVLRDLVELVGIARKFVTVAKALQRGDPDAALGELSRLAPDDPASMSAQVTVTTQLVAGALDGWITATEGREAGLQGSIAARQGRADADADAIRAEATRLLARDVAARYIVGTIARTLKHSPAKVRRALRTHEAGHWVPGPRTKRSLATR